MNKTTQTVESAAVGGAFHIEDVYPLIDGGRFPVKRIVGERVDVWADIYRDGHDVISAALVWRLERDREWRREPMTHHSNDRWGGSFVPDAPGRYVYAIEAWTDEFATWRHGFELKQNAGADLTLDAIEVHCPTLDDVFLTLTGRSLRDAEAATEKPEETAPEGMHQ